MTIDDYDDKVNNAIEIGFGAMVRAANNQGIPLDPVMGLLYLSDPKITQQFRDAGKAVLGSILKQP